MTRRQATAAAAALFLRPRFGLAANTTGQLSNRIRTVRLPEGAIQPQVVREASGVLHLVYYVGDPRSGNLFYARSTGEGGTFSGGLPVNSPGSAIAAGTIRGAQLAVGRNGRVHVAWNGSPSSQPRGIVNPDSGKPGEPMLYARMNPQGTAFEPQRNLMLHSFGLDGGGTIAAGRNGNVYVMWHGVGEHDAKGELEGEARRQVWLALSHDDGASFAAETKAWQQKTGACGCCGMKAFVAADGTVYALYRSATESVHRDVYLLRSTGGGATFSGRLLHKWDINACPMSSMDFAEQDGRVVAAWETGGQVYWAVVSGSGAAKPVAAPGEGKGRKHPRVAINHKGELLFVWTEGTGWQRGGALAWQVYDAAGQPVPDSGSLPGIAAWSFAAPVANPNGSFSVIL